MNVKWYEQSEGVTSCIRIIAMIGAICGAITLLTGTVSFLFSYENAVGLAAVGAGMFSLSEFFKQAQKKHER